MPRRRTGPKDKWHFHSYWKSGKRHLNCVFKAQDFHRLYEDLTALKEMNKLSITGQELLQMMDEEEACLPEREANDREWEAYKEKHRRPR